MKSNNPPKQRQHSRTNTKSISRSSITRAAENRLVWDPVGSQGFLPMGPIGGPSVPSHGIPFKNSRFLTLLHRIRCRMRWKCLDPFLIDVGLLLASKQVRKLPAVARMVDAGKILGNPRDCKTRGSQGRGGRQREAGRRGGGEACKRGGGEAGRRGGGKARRQASRRASTQRAKTLSSPVA